MWIAGIKYRFDVTAQLGPSHALPTNKPKPEYGADKGPVKVKKARQE
jgi:hypothetical protein